MRKIRKSVRLADTLQSRQPPAADGLWQRRRRIVVAPPTDCGSAADGLWQRRRWIKTVWPPRAHARNALAGGNPPTTRPCIRYWQKNALAVTMRKIRKSVRLADTLQSRQSPQSLDYGHRIKTTAHRLLQTAHGGTPCPTAKPSGALRSYHPKMDRRGTFPVILC